MAKKAAKAGAAPARTRSSERPAPALRINVLPDVRQLAVPDGSGKDEMVLGTSSEAF